MSSLERLNRIRAQFAKPLTPICDKCGHDLTVENTKYFVTEICENCFQHARVIDIKTCCDKEDYHVVKMVTAGGSIQVRQQCRNCGNVRPNAIGGYDKDAREKLPSIDLTAREAREKTYAEQYREFYAKIAADRHKNATSRRDQIRSNWFKDYNKYLDSPEWREKRALVLKRDGNLCQCCLLNVATQVHHKSYEFVDLKGSEPAFDLVAICGPCHDRIEEIKKRNKEIQ